MAKKKTGTTSRVGHPTPSRKRAAKKAAKRKLAAVSVGSQEMQRDPALTDEEIELALVTGLKRAELERLFGLEEYAELRELARASGQARSRGTQRVLTVSSITNTPKRATARSR